MAGGGVDPAQSVGGVRIDAGGDLLDVADRIAYDVLARQVMYGPTFESRVQIGWEELVGELTAAALDYLRGTGTSSP